MKPKLEFSPYLAQIVTALKQSSFDLKDIYLVGGAVRDALQQKPSHDLDFVVVKESLRTARKVADALGGAYFTLDEEFQVGRVVMTLEDVPRQVFDFVRLQGNDLEADLRHRDFTMNAMAVSMDTMELIDPLGGAADLLQGKLALCSDSALLDDPVRVVRAVRMVALYELSIPPEIQRLIPAAVDKLEEVSAERLRDEFLKVLDSPKPAISLRLLDRFGVLEQLIPEVEAMKGVTQSEPHIYDVWEHSLHTVEALVKILTILDKDYEHDNKEGGDLFTGLLSSLLGRYREQITEHLNTTMVPDRPSRPLIFLAALLHDFTKPQHRTVEESGRIRFTGHESSGARQIVKRGNALKLSRAEINRLVRVLQDHMRPWQFARSGETLTKRAIHRFWRDNGGDGIDVCLVALADLKGIFGHTLTKEIMESHFAAVRSLLEAWFEQPEVVSPPVLLDGNDLINTFELNPGPRIGELLDLLREAQAAGEVQTREEAEEFITSQLRNS